MSLLLIYIWGVLSCNTYYFKLKNIWIGMEWINAKNERTHKWSQNHFTKTSKLIARSWLQKQAENIYILFPNVLLPMNEFVYFHKQTLLVWRSPACRLLPKGRLENGEFFASLLKMASRRWPHGEFSNGQIFPPLTELHNEVMIDTPTEKGPTLRWWNIIGLYIS